MMKLAPDTAPWKISDEAAEKDLKKYHKLAWIASGITFFVLGFASFVGIGLGIRSIILSWRPINAVKPDGLKYKISSIAATLLGVIDYFAWVALSHRH